MDDEVIGSRYGRMVVLEPAEGYSFYWCACDCGSKKRVRLDHLMRGATRSCGCLARELLLQRKPLKPEDRLEGQRFGILTVVGLEPDGPRLWRCVCDCGGVKSVAAGRLRQGLVSSCGCMKPPRIPIDAFAGERFTRLKAIREVQPRGKHIKYECRCSCGETHIAYLRHLLSGATQSCGCLRREPYWMRHSAVCKNWGVVVRLWLPRLGIGTVLRQMPQRDQRRSG